MKFIKITMVPVLVVFMLVAFKTPRFTTVDVNYATYFSCKDDNDTGFFDFNAQVHFFKGKKALANSLNIFSLNSGINTKITHAPTQDEFKELLLENCRQIHGDFKLINARLCHETAKNFKKTWKSTIYFKSKKAISYGIDNYFNTAAPNPYYYLTCGVFNCHTGQQYSIADMVTDSSAFAKFVQKKYAVYQQEQKGVPPSAAGFFSDGSFWLSSNFYLTPSSLIFHYNLYQIGPYEQGESKIEISLDELKPWLKIVL